MTDHSCHSDYDQFCIIDPNEDEYTPENSESSHLIHMYSPTNLHPAINIWSICVNVYKYLYGLFII